MTRADALAIATITALGLAFLPAALEANSEAANRVRCANNLRQLGLAAIQYADDKRFYPHNEKLLQLDGDASTNHTPRLVRAMLWYGYHDNPAGLICPSSDDRALRIKDPKVEENLRRWFWGRKSIDPKQNPWRGADPALTHTTELSYGWTRKAMNSNVRSTALLSADRAVRDGKTQGPMHGNHADGWNVLRTDATVSFWKVTDNKGQGDAGTQLVGTQRGCGYLALRHQKAADFKGLARKPAPIAPWKGFYSDGTVWVELQPRSWDPYRGRYSFEGTLYRGEHRFPLTGTCGAAELRGTMDGGRDMPITIQAGPQSLVFASEGLKRTLKRIADPKQQLLDRVVAGAKAGARGKVSACFTPAAQNALASRYRGGWFAGLQAEVTQNEPRFRAMLGHFMKLTFAGKKPKLTPSLSR